MSRKKREEREKMEKETPVLPRRDTVDPKEVEIIIPWGIQRCALGMACATVSEVGGWAEAEVSADRSSIIITKLGLPVQDGTHASLQIDGADTIEMFQRGELDPEKAIVSWHSHVKMAAEPSANIDIPMYMELTDLMPLVVGIVLNQDNKWSAQVWVRTPIGPMRAKTKLVFGATDEPAEVAGWVALVAERVRKAAPPPPVKAWNEFPGHSFSGHHNSSSEPIMEHLSPFGLHGTLLISRVGAAAQLVVREDGMTDGGKTRAYISHYIPVHMVPQRPIYLQSPGVVETTEEVFLHLGLRAFNITQQLTSTSICDWGHCKTVADLVVVVGTFGPVEWCIEHFCKVAARIDPVKLKGAIAALDDVEKNTDKADCKHETRFWDSMISDLRCDDCKKPIVKSEHEISGEFYV